MPRKVAEQVVVVTGASSGVGRAVARAFGQAGARVGLIARTEEALANAADEISRAGGEALVLPLDVADAAAVQAAGNRVVEWSDGARAVLNVAGHPVRAAAALVGLGLRGARALA